MDVRPIDADALGKDIIKLDPFVLNDDEKCDVLREIRHQPTLDLAPIKHADWLEHGCSTFCTRCGEKPLYDYFGKLKLSNYCPNCGAQMDGGKKDG